MEVLEVYEHEHPLKLIDLHLHFEEEEEEEDEGGDPIIKEGFQGVTCGRCKEEIHMYHRYYYKCCSSSCDDNVFSLHKFCAELPSRLDHPLHPSHTLHLAPSHPPHTFHLEPYSDLIGNYNHICKICKRDQKQTLGEHCYNYKCYECDFSIDLKCVVEVGKNIIHHPCHPHLLICAIPKPILCHCSACGEEHKGMFYQCTICAGFTINSDCAFLPEKLLIQQRTNGAFYHTHLLTISYSFPFIDQEAKHWPRCRLCSEGFSSKEDLWIYKCDKCVYYAHLDCIRVPPYIGGAKTVKNYEDVDYPRLLDLPFPDETYSLPKHMFFQECDDHHKVDYLKHDSHQHPLILVEQTLITNGKTSSSWLLKCHDPMKETRLLCNGCLRPITPTMPFYRCVSANDIDNDDQIQIQIQGGCNNFALHEWCTRLPPIIENHPGHPQHTLRLVYPKSLPFLFSVFCCDVCCLLCNGFAYCCVKCDYYVDVTCGLIPREIKHESHSKHLLSIVQIEDKETSCHMCLKSHYSSRLSFHCNTCNIFIHPHCALLLAKTIRHKYDKKHPMHLSYLPIENHKSEYFCEICEDDLNPHQSFYHCQDCSLSVHSACAPLILQCETQTCGWYSWKSTYYFVNIKFGGILNAVSHSHPLSFAQGIVLDGQCSICGQGLQYQLIFKCLECKYMIDYFCCKRLNKI